MTKVCVYCGRRFSDDVKKCPSDFSPLHKESQKTREYFSVKHKRWILAGLFLVTWIVVIFGVLLFFCTQRIIVPPLIGPALSLDPVGVIKKILVTWVLIFVPLTVVFRHIGKNLRQRERNLLNEIVGKRKL